MMSTGHVTSLDNAGQTHSKGRGRGRRWDKAKQEAQVPVVDAKANAAITLSSADDALSGFWDGPGDTDTSLTKTNSTSQAASSALPLYYGSALRALHGQSADQDDTCSSAEPSLLDHTWRQSAQKQDARGELHGAKGRGQDSTKGHGRAKGQTKSSVGYSQPKHTSKGMGRKGKKGKVEANKLEVAGREPESTQALVQVADGGNLLDKKPPDIMSESPPQQADLPMQSILLKESQLEREVGVPEAVDDAAIAIRTEERESLEAIYGTEFDALGEAEWLICLSEHASLHIFLPAGYPEAEPPTPVINIEPGIPPPGLAEQLAELWVPGEICIYQWVEHLREVLGAEDLSGWSAEQSGDDRPSCENDEAIAMMVAQSDDLMDEELVGGVSFTYMPAAPQYGQRRREFGTASDDPRHSVELLHGEPFVDRKSTFQAHLALVTSVEQVHWAHRQLLADKKIAAATHNIVAYRFRDDIRNVLVADNDDDGETAAGARLAELLELRGVIGVFVMVSRWYGGIQLGPDRFKHINRAAQLLLDSAGLSKHAGNGAAGTASDKPKATKKKH